MTRGRALGIGKNVGNVFPRRNSKITARRQARPIVRNVLFAKVISTPSSHPLDKDGPFGEVEYGCKAENKDAVKWRNQKRELKMGFLVPICMLAMIVICAATLTRL